MDEDEYLPTEEEIEALALEGLLSGESIVADEKYWQEKRDRIIALPKI